MWVTTEAMDVALVTDATQAVAGVAGILNGAKAKVYVANVNPTKTTVLADLTFATGALATPLTVTWSAADRSFEGSIGTNSNLLAFAITGGDPTVTLYGLALLNSGGTVLLGCCNLDAPYPLTDTLDVLELVARWQTNNPSNAGGVSVV